MHKILIKCLLAILGGLFFLAGFVFLLSQIDFFGGGSHSFLFLLLPIGVGIIGCVPLGWFNSGSLVRGLFGAAIAVIGGVPFGYLILVPLAEKVLQVIAPYGNLTLSGSFTSIWLLITPIALVELLTDDGLKKQRWQGLVIGLLSGVSLSLTIEVLTMDLGHDTQSSLIKLAFYSPILWGITTGATNLPRREK